MSYPKIVIIIPCYNEEKRLNLNKFQEFVKKVDNIRFLFVNDGSTDNTMQLLERLRDSNPDVFYIYHLRQNMGKGEAIRCGFLRASKLKADYIGFLDADLACPLETMLSFCNFLNERPDIDIIFGSRVRLLGRVIERSALRHLFGRLFATGVGLMLGVPIYDSQCGAKLFRVSTNIIELFQEPFITRWFFDVEIIARLIEGNKKKKLRQVEDIAYEIPISHWHEVDGTKIRYYDFITTVLNLFRIYRRYKKFL